MKRSALVLALFLMISLKGHGQARGGGRGGPPPTPRAGAPFEVTGYSVSNVTEDWRWRIFPIKGDYGVNRLNQEGRRLADAWDPAKEEAAAQPCKGYGIPAIMPIPGRFHITRHDDQTLKI